jgi:hypothetical protein
MRFESRKRKRKIRKQKKKEKEKEKKRVKRKKNHIRIKPSGPKTRNSPLKNLKSRSSCTRQSGEKFPQVPERWLQQGRAHRARGRAK